jgi:anti-sigma regulatory factor (Ser/Thr protein kinase)
MAKTATMSGERLLWGHPAQVRTARRFVVASLAGRRVAVDRDVVALLVSELVTNAVVHSASGRADGTLLVAYQLAREGPDPKRLRLRVEVRDLGSPGYPRRCPHALESSGRRGLEVVEALASRWGVGCHPRGRVVWFELELAQVDRDGGAWA